jgi:hypothetical protein
MFPDDFNVWQSCLLVPGISRAECASWVQAWGSIVALAIAIGLGVHQTRAAASLEARSRRELDRRMIAVVNALAESGALMCKTFGTDWTKEQLERLPDRLEEIKDVRELLSRVDPLALPMEEVGVELLRLPRLLTGLDDAARRMDGAFRSSGRHDFEVAEIELRSSLAKAQRCFRVIKMLCGRFLIG